MEIDNNTSQNNSKPLSQDSILQNNLEQKGYFLPMIGVIILVIVVGLFSYNLGKSRSTTYTTIYPSPSPTSTPVGNPSKSDSMMPKSKEAYSKEINNAGWIDLTSSELGISFTFPVPKGSLNFSVHEYPRLKTGNPSGASYGWSIGRYDIPGNEGWSYSFIGGISTDFEEGRSRWITDTYRWIKQDDKYYVEQSRGYKYAVEPLKIIKHPSGVEAIVFDPNRGFWSAPMNINPRLEDQVAVLNFPEGYSIDFKSITFYFYDKTPLEDIEKVINSVKFTK